MARLDDIQSLVQSERGQANAKTPKPGASQAENHSTLDVLLYPVVIINRRGEICYTNDAARRLLGEGLDRRLVAHVTNNPDMTAITQVHFKLQNGHDLILKVRLGEIEWLGEKATQVLISNVTPYLAMIQELQKDLRTQRQSLDEVAAREPDLEQQVAAHSEALVKLQVQLEAESAGRAKAQENARGLRKDLDLAAQENNRLRTDLATVTRVREDLKESRQRLQKLVEELQGAAAQFQTQDAAGQAELEEHARSLAAELEKTRADLDLETRKSAEVCKTRETEREEFVSRAAASAALLEEARKQADAEGSKRRQVQADLEKARGAVAASEEIHFKLRQELEALRRDMKQLSARGEGESAHVAELVAREPALDARPRRTQRA